MARILKKNALQKIWTCFFIYTRKKQFYIKRIWTIHYWNSGLHIRCIHSTSFGRFPFNVSVISGGKQAIPFFNDPIRTWRFSGRNWNTSDLINPLRKKSQVLSRVGEEPPDITLQGNSMSRKHVFDDSSKWRDVCEDAPSCWSQRWSALCALTISSTFGRRKFLNIALLWSLFTLLSYCLLKNSRDPNTWTEE